MNTTAARIRDLEWQVSTRLPHEIKTTTNARRIASLRRQMAKARAELAALKVSA